MRDELVSLAVPGEGTGVMRAHLALPGKTPAPGLIVVQEAYGVNRHIRDVCHRLATLGYVALAPELFHRTGYGVELPYDDMTQVMPHFSRLTNATILHDLGAAHAFLAAHDDVAGGTGVVGFCVGGFAALLAASRLPITTAVAFYPGGVVRERPGLGLTPIVAELETIEIPVLAHFGATDHGIPLTDVALIKERLEQAQARHPTRPPQSVLVHEGAGHGFFCDERAAYDAGAARAAWDRTRAWLGSVLPVS
jgi:carboxymethylenebutenolidase